MKLALDVQYACQCDRIPGEKEMIPWIEAALVGRREQAALTVRIVDEEEGLQLNARWRGGSSPTNVLSFPVSGLEEFAPELLGDIVICAPVVQHEALAQDKLLSTHWAHMIIHGTLHLLGFDHVEEADAQTMEGLEIELLAALGYPNPYLADLEC